jgi:hypothetical protein
MRWKSREALELKMHKNVVPPPEAKAFVVRRAW